MSFLFSWPFCYVSNVLCWSHVTGRYCGVTPIWFVHCDTIVQLCGLQTFHFMIIPQFNTCIHMVCRVSCCSNMHYSLFCGDEDKYQLIWFNKRNTLCDVFWCRLTQHTHTQPRCYKTLKHSTVFYWVINSLNCSFECAILPFYNEITLKALVGRCEFQKAFTGAFWSIIILSLEDDDAAKVVTGLASHNGLICSWLSLLCCLTKKYD